MTLPIVKVENLSKNYYIGVSNKQAPTLLVSRMAKAFLSPLRRLTNSRLARAGTDNVAEIWALKNISFDLQQGEVLGIIGENGSGKSTLLKIISHITAPSEGKVTLHGRVGSLLEVGIGFHPDLTGRENVYLSGAVQGMKSANIDRIFDEIVDFSGVEKFIDTPVKYYSSGMYVRLAFSVAVNLDPEILILDEVLAVGDAAFQKKSMERMEKLAKSGKTVLFVSHGMANVSRICTHGLYLRQGELVQYGHADEIVKSYLEYLYQFDQDRLEKEGKNGMAPYLDLWDSKKRWPGFSERILSWVSVHRMDGTPCTSFNTGDDMLIRIGYHLERDLISYCNINVLNYDGTVVMTIKNFHGGSKQTLTKGDGFLECKIQDLRLISGNYIFMLAIGDYSGNEPQWLDTIGDTLHIKVDIGDYLNGFDISGLESTFAQRSEWKIIKK
jgi:lipopolysaccharide transport system ATP-binding protein